MNDTRAASPRVLYIPRRRGVGLNKRQRENARSYANTYQQRGLLTPQPCEVCGSTDVEKHHPDYDKPLQVRWLCRKHHAELTRGERQMLPPDVSDVTEEDRSTWFTKQEVAARLHVTTKTVERLAQEGQVQQARWRRPTGGPTLVVYHPQDVARLVQERQPAPLAMMGYLTQSSYRLELACRRWGVSSDKPVRRLAQWTTSYRDGSENRQSKRLSISFGGSSYLLGVPYSIHPSGISLSIPCGCWQ